MTSSLSHSRLKVKVKKTTRHCRECISCSQTWHNQWWQKENSGTTTPTPGAWNYDELDESAIFILFLLFVRAIAGLKIISGAIVVLLRQLNNLKLWLMAVSFVQLLWNQPDATVHDGTRCSSRQYSKFWISRFEFAAKNDCHWGGETSGEREKFGCLIGHPMMSALLIWL
jgi:hypothetical protein